MLTDLNAKFMNMIEEIIREKYQHAEAELEKAKHHKELLELPPKKENWSAQENAEEKMMEHIKKTLQIMAEVDILMDGLLVFQDGLTYRRLREKGTIRKSVR